MNIKAKLASLAAVAIIVGTQYPIASNADQPTLQAGDYIVVFNDRANEQAEAAKLRGQGANITYTYSAVFKGLAGTFNSAQLTALQKNPNVKLIEKDGIATIDTAQSSATWGLDRINQANRPLDGVYSYTSDGTGVKAYVIDTGIYAAHIDFEGRVLTGKNYVSDRNGTNDCNGHGTHVAGTIGSKTYGVAKKVSLIPVRVLDCRGSGTWSNVISGINWVATDHPDLAPAVANLSLGGGFSQAINDAIAGLVADGVTVSVAAGNSTADACNYSPASEPLAITVGATDSLDNQASYSNFGSCVDIYAPGSSITSTWINTSKKTNTTNTISGTSMASPHVAGVAALYLSTSGNSSKSPAVVRDAIVNAATSGVLIGLVPSSPNKLLFTNY